MSAITPLRASEDHFYLPEIWSPVPARWHPKAEGLEARSNQWTRRHMRFAIACEADMKLLLERRYAGWICLCYPDAGAERALAMCDFTQYLFILDDVFSKGDGAGKDAAAARVMFNRIVPALRDRDRAPDRDFAYGRALEDVWARFCLEMAPALERIVAAHVKRYLDGYVQEVASRAKSGCLDYESYLAVRLDSVGIRPYIALLEYALGIDLPEEVRFHQDIRKLNELTLRNIIHVNDLLSFRREHYLGDGMNSISVFRGHEGLDLQDAVFKLWQMIDDGGRAFVETRDAIRSGPLAARPDVLAYVKGLEQFIAGNQQWSFLTPRYHGSGYVWNGVTSGLVKLDPNGSKFVGRD